MRRISSLACASCWFVGLVALAPGVSADLADPPRFIGTDVAQDELLDVISTARSRSFKPVGHTSVVLRMRTVARVTAAIKVRSEALPEGYKHEIAAYRIARLLGLDNVPPAIHRRVAWTEIRRRFHDDKLDERPAVRRAIYGVKGMRSVGNEKRSAWSDWLQDGAIPRGKEDLARDLSNMAVFDLLIGNWDRFSGGNLPSDSSRKRAILRDNDRAFSSPLLPKRQEALVEGLRHTERFSRSVIQRLSDLDERMLREELSQDPSDASSPLLNDAQMADVFDRRATILSYVAALVEQRGIADVLVFP